MLDASGYRLQTTDLGTTFLLVSDEFEIFFKIQFNFDSLQTFELETIVTELQKVSSW